MESRIPVLGSHSETLLKYGKIEHDNGLKFGSPYIGTLLMYIIREFKYKLIEVSHV